MNLGVLDGEGVVHIDQVAGTRSIVSWVGGRTPYHFTSNGKVLLAHLDETERKRLLAVPLERLTGNTIVDPDRLRAQFVEIRPLGYAQTIEEFEAGLNAVAAPVRRADGEVVAAVNVEGPAFWMRPMERPGIARMTIEAAGFISRRMGYVERRQSVGSG